MKFNGKSAKFARLRIGLKTEHIAGMLNISRRTLWAWENGRNAPTEKMVRNLAEVLKINVSEISDLPDESLFSKENLVETASLNYEVDALNGVELKLNYLMNNLRDVYTKASESNLITTALLYADKTIFYIKTTSLKYVAAGCYYKKILGYTEDYDFKGKSDSRIMSSKDAKLNENHEREILLSANSVSNQEMIIPGTKGKRWGLFTKSPIRDKYGKVAGIVVNGIDITELRTEEQRIAYAIGTTTKNKSVIWRAKLNSNGSFNCKFISKDEAEKSFGKLLAEKIIDSFRVTKAIINAESKYSYTHSFNILINQKEEWVKETIYKDNRNYYGIVKSYTEKKNIKRLRKTLELNFANMKDGVVIQHDITKEIIYANHAVELIYERKVNDYFHKNIDEVWLNELVHPDDKMLLKGLYDKDKYPTRRTFRIITPGGKIKWIEATVSYRIIADGIPTVITIDRDITDRVIHEEKGYLLKTFFDNINGFIIIFDKDRISYISESVDDLLGVKPFEIYQNSNLFTQLFCIADGTSKLNFSPNNLLDCNESKFLLKNRNNEIIEFESSFFEIKTGEKYGIVFNAIVR